MWNNRGAIGVLVAVLMIVVAVPLVGGIFMGPAMMGSGMGPWMMGRYFPDGAPVPGNTLGMMVGAGWMLMIAFWAVLIIGVALIARWVLKGSGASEPTTAEKPLDILQRRYAEGELTQEQYEEARSVLAA